LLFAINNQLGAVNLNIENALIRYVGYGKNITLIKRDVRLHEGNFINSIIGPRRAGKTSLMLMYKKTLNTPESNKIFINCEDIDFVGVKPDDLDKIEEAMYRIYKPDETKNIHLFIDEAQTFPQWSRWLRTLFDQGKYKLYITGSTSDLSADNLPSELRGRAINTIVLPFSFKEYLAVKNIVVRDYLSANETGRVEDALSDFLDFGGYPEVVKSNDSALKHILLAELYATVIQRDLVEKFRIRKTAVFKAFINSLFGSVCRNISLSTVVSWFAAQGTKISSQTALNYLSYAQSVFLFVLIYPYSRKVKERNTKPRLYVSDSGVLGLFESDKAKKLENAVLVELIRRRVNVHYYKSSSADVDFVVVKDSRACELIQVCYSLDNPLTYKREMRSLLSASEELKCDNLWVITFNQDKIIEQGSKKIKVSSAWRWFLED